MTRTCCFSLCLHVLGLTSDECSKKFEIDSKSVLWYRNHEL
ncbi:unnamed protein product [Tenebrio molitor]|nr:unnamed protein product [Tenebrio molitor]